MCVFLEIGYSAIIRLSMESLTQKFKSTNFLACDPLSEHAFPLQPSREEPMSIVFLDYNELRYLLAEPMKLGLEKGV